MEERAAAKAEEVVCVLHDVVSCLLQLFVGTPTARGRTSPCPLLKLQLDQHEPRTAFEHQARKKEQMARQICSSSKMGLSQRSSKLVVAFGLSQ